MKRKDREKLGEVLCAHRTCNAVATVYAYRSAASRASAARFAGRLYAVCPEGHRCEDQGYIKGAASWSERQPEGEEKPASVSASDAVEQPKETASPKPATQSKPKPKPATLSEVVETAKGWGFFR